MVTDESHANLTVSSEKLEILIDHSLAPFLVRKGMADRVFQHPARHIAGDRWYWRRALGHSPGRVGGNIPVGGGVGRCRAAHQRPANQYKVQAIW